MTKVALIPATTIAVRKTPASAKFVGHRVQMPKSAKTDCHCQGVGWVCDHDAQELVRCACVDPFEVLTTR